MSMKYFIGIAMNNKVRNEIPSANATILNNLIWLIVIFLQASQQTSNSVAISQISFLLFQYDWLVLLPSL